MAQMQDQITPIGEILYPSLVTAGADLSSNGCWQCGLRITLDEAQPIIALVDEVLAEYRRDNPTFPPAATWKNRQGREEYLNFPYRPARRRISDDQYEIIEGKIDLSFKRLVKTRKGYDSTPPVILSSKGQMVKNPPEITYGSVGRIIFSPFVYDNQSKGVAFYLKGAQIKSIAANVLSAPPMDDGWDPFDDSSQVIAAANNGGPFLPDNSDEIPF
jgi:hypothetical protein